MICFSTHDHTKKKMEDKDLLIEQLKQRIRELENQLIQKKKSGNRSSRNGKEYEIEIHRVLQNVMIVFTKMNRIKIILSIRNMKRN